jgi:cell volume regulation protein A
VHFPEAVSTDILLLSASGLLVLSVLASKISGRFGVPALLLFLAIGMLAGSDGPGGIAFDNPWIAKSLGVLALAYILFSGGLDTQWTSLRRVLWQGLSLSTLGVLLTAALVGAFAMRVLNFSLTEGLLLGAVVSSTDAAAVFSILKARNVSLQRRLQPLLEFESASNDPMAVFLTLAVIRLIAEPSTPVWVLVPWFVWQMALGALLGWALGKLLIFTLNRIRLEYEGLYPVLTLAFVPLIYAVTAVLGGSGFLAVYAAGLVLSQKDFLYKKTLSRFHDGIAWLMQIVMFLALGLLVFPSKLLQVAAPALATALFLMLIARPASVFASLLLSKLGLRDKFMLSWVGLRGAAPIILSTFVLLAGVPRAELIFNIVFFVVLTSVLFQGTSLPLAAKLLRVDAPLEKKRRYPIEFEQTEGVDTDLLEFIIPFNSAAAGKAIYELGLPAGSLIAMVCRGDRFIVASGKTVLEEGDVALALVDRESRGAVQTVLSRLKTAKPSAG